jgi:ABC-type lipoprotein export system ATPase subunit
MVTHDLRLCQYVDRVLQMQDGKVVRITDKRTEAETLAQNASEHHVRELALASVN